MRPQSVEAYFGAFFAVLAGAVVVFADAPLTAGPVVVALCLALLGVDALLAARSGRRSLLSRIGPLP
jgi:acyl-CoA synthetase (AMP-forming)/AMP-acid ligase II